MKRLSCSLSCSSPASSTVHGGTHRTVTSMGGLWWTCRERKQRTLNLRSLQPWSLHPSPPDWQFPRIRCHQATQAGQLLPAPSSRPRGASGAVNRSSSPESVRYMSVTSVVRRRLLTKDDRG